MELSRGLYTVLATALSPLLPLRLWWRGRREPGYRVAIGERFGRYRRHDRMEGTLFWLHAVSVGETHAALPIVERIERAHPQARVLLTHMTAAGREAGRTLLGDRVLQSWLPYDLPFAVRGFLTHFKPSAGLLLETELWPNLIAGASARDIPMFLLNARLSESSARGYARIAPLARAMLARLSGVAAQSAADAARFTALGAATPFVTGNLKFDVAMPPDAASVAATLKARIDGRREIWLAASTRDGEEELVLDALRRRPLAFTALLVLVPRHPQRFDDVAALLDARRISYVRRSGTSRVTSETRVLLGDSMGEMASYLVLSSLAFIGGSLLPLGGQNLIEATAAGRPVLFGPHMFNFAEAASHAMDAGAARQVADADALVEAVGDMLGDAAACVAMASAARRFHAAHAGAADRTWAWLERELSRSARG